MRAYSVFLLLFMVPFFVSCASGFEPIYPNSVVSNDHEFIKTSDESAYACVVYQSTARAQMPDSRTNRLFADGVFIFEARYRDGTSVELWAHPDFQTKENALVSVEPVAQAVGKLPTFMRSKLDHVVVHEGDRTAYSEHLGRFFVVYSDNIQTRINNHDLEETVFHESVHATLDHPLRDSQEWKGVQLADGAFITEYAKDNPETEDMAESALFAWAMIMHPGRLPDSVEASVREIMLYRLTYFEKLFLAQPQFTTLSADTGCLN